MNSSLRSSVLSSILAVLPLAPAAFAQTAPTGSDTAAIAAAIVRAQAPATDDPDAVVADLVSTALTHRRSPVAWVLVQEAIYFVNSIQDAAKLRDLLTTSLAGERQHGRLAQKCTELRWWLDRACDGVAKTGHLPGLGYCKHALVVGPLGDDGDNFVGIAMAPELRFPALGAELPGRGTIARVREVATRRGSDYLELHVPGQPRPGCYYALHRFAVEAAVDAFVEIEFDGDFQLFVDETEVLRVERWKATAPRRHEVGLHLPAGEHTVLLKTCSSEKDRYTLRWLDADAAPASGVRQIPIPDPAAPIAQPATTNDAVFVTAMDVLARAAEQEGADPGLRLAALLLAERENHHDLALRICEPLRSNPPSDPEHAMAFARLLRSAPLPDELRKAAARRIEEPAIAALPATHHAARMAKVQLLDEQDQREQALRLLAEHPAPGPWTFARRHGLVRELKFTAEELPLLTEWAAACPRDARPLYLLAEQARSVNDGARAHAFRLDALARSRDMQGNVQQALFAALDTGDMAQASAWIEEVDPAPGDAPELYRLRYESLQAEAGGDRERLGDLLRRMIVHPEANTPFLLDLAGRLARLPDPQATVACLRRCREQQPDNPRVRAWLEALGELPPADAEFAPFRRDGDAAQKAFVAGEREQSASSTVVIDQRILSLQDDGSWTSETHELRRINDQAGVDAFRTADGLGEVDEVLLVRTIGTDGQTWVPGRVENEYALQRLEPGAFVEWRFRERSVAPGADPLSAGTFLFGSDSEPAVVSELVVILPANGRGELRTRDLGDPVETRDLGDGRKALVFRRENIPSLPREQYLPPTEALLPIAQVGEDAAPFATMRQIRVQIGLRTRPQAPIEDLARGIFANLAGERAIAEAAWKWCQTEIESGPADNATTTLLHKKGSRFLLAVALMRAAGLQVVPMAFAQSRPELTPSGDSLFAPADEHDTPGALVTLATGERIHLFLDAPRHWPLGAVPAGRAGSRAFALHDDQVESIVLPGSKDAVQTIRVRGSGTIEGNEVRIDAVAEIGDLQGYGLADRLRQLKDQQQKQAARQIAQQIFEGFRVRNAFLADVPPGEPLRLEVTVTRAGVQQKGDGFVMPLPLPPTKYVAAFGDRAERTLPYFFPGDLLSEWEIEIAAGSGHRFVECPAPIAVRMANFAHELQCTLTADSMRFVRHVRVGPMTLPANRFGEWLRTLAQADRAEQLSIELAARKTD